MNDDSELLAVLTAHKKIYPLMQLQDAVKLAYQHEFGCAHISKRPDAALAYLVEECASVGSEDGPLTVDIGSGLCRVELRAMERHGVTPEDVFGWMLATAEAHRGSMQRFQAALDMLAQDGLSFCPTRGDAERFISDYRAMGCPALHHSAAYAAAYSPAYRVVLAELVLSGELKAQD